MANSFSIRRIFHQFFPRKAANLARGVGVLAKGQSVEERRARALDAQARAELMLHRGDLGALPLFEQACALDPENGAVWLRQAQSFFEYGARLGQERTLFLACKYFKMAARLDAASFQAWDGWASALLLLGKVHEEPHFFLEARQKLERAVALSADQPTTVQAELHWDLGVCLFNIGKHSKEAQDLALAAQAFERAQLQDENLPAEFSTDMAACSMELGLLLNDADLLDQAAELLERAVKERPAFLEGWEALAENYGQIYLYSMDERWVDKASDAWDRVTTMRKTHGAAWLRWAELLTETGRVNRDVAALKSSVEKCRTALPLYPKEPDALVQLVQALSELGLASGEASHLAEALNLVKETLKQYPDDLEVWYAEGICLMAHGKYFQNDTFNDQAIDALQNCLAEDRSDAEVWHALGRANKQSLDLVHDPKMAERAAHFFARALDLKPHYPALVYDTAIALLDLSEFFDDSAALDSSLGLFEMLLQQQASVFLRHPEWIFGYACALDWVADWTGEENDYARAIEYFSHVLALDPEFPGAHALIAHNYIGLGHLSADPEHYRKAISFFKQAARLDDENDQTWLEWGICLMHLGRLALNGTHAESFYTLAEQKVRKAGQLGASCAYYALACLASLRGQIELAMSHIQKAMSLKALPSIEQMLEEDALDAVRKTSAFTDFLAAIEAKLQAREQ